MAYPIDSILTEFDDLGPTIERRLEQAAGGPVMYVLLVGVRGEAGFTSCSNSGDMQEGTGLARAWLADVEHAEH